MHNGEDFGLWKRWVKESSTSAGVCVLVKAEKTICGKMRISYSDCRAAGRVVWAQPVESVKVVQLACDRERFKE